VAAYGCRHLEGGGGSPGAISNEAEDAAHCVSTVIANGGAAEDELQCMSQ
jgi:hypothetical protein